jgi:hypothetical protein
MTDDRVGARGPLGLLQLGHEGADGSSKFELQEGAG